MRSRDARATSRRASAGLPDDSRSRRSTRSVARNVQVSPSRRSRRIAGDARVAGLFGQLGRCALDEPVRSATRMLSGEAPAGRYGSDISTATIGGTSRRGSSNATSAKSISARSCRSRPCATFTMARKRPAPDLGCTTRAGRKSTRPASARRSARTSTRASSSSGRSSEPRSSPSNSMRSPSSAGSRALPVTSTASCARRSDSCTRPSCHGPRPVSRSS